MSDIKEVKWKRGFHTKGSARVAFNQLEKIRGKSNGALTPGAVVIAARNKSNPLHTHFEWDDSIAAEKHRIDQSKYLIRSLEVVYEDAPNINPQRVYVTVTEEKKVDMPARKVYKTIEETLKDPVARDELLGNAIRDALTYRRKYAMLSELANVFHALDEFVEHSNVV